MMRDILNFYRWQMRLEWRQKERFIAALLIALVMQVLMAFLFGQVAEADQPLVFVAALVLSTFIAAEVTLSRIFDHDSQDRVIDQLHVLPTHKLPFYIAKVKSATTFGAVIALASIGMGSLFIGDGARQILGDTEQTLIICATVIVAQWGLAALGVLLHLITLTARTAPIVYPILFYPLTMPIFLGLSQGLVALQSPGVEIVSSWLWLMALFAMLYTVLGSILAEDLF